MNLKQRLFAPPADAALKSPVDGLAKRVRAFQRGFARQHQKELSDLVRYGQKPTRLFISCADSRIVPDALTGSKPGENFSVRVVGNIVPPYDLAHPDVAVGSAVEYAVKVLGIEEIIVCGHSHCGACAALITGNSPELVLTHRWLEHGLPVRKAIETQLEAGGLYLGQVLASHDSRNEVFRAAERAMVVSQLKNLRSYPFVEELVAKGELRVRGWYYEIEKGLVEQYDAKSLSFVPVAQASSRPTREPEGTGAGLAVVPTVDNQQRSTLQMKGA
jgi:carbonic anhydrase